MLCNLSLVQRWALRILFHYGYTPPYRRTTSTLVFSCLCTSALYNNETSWEAKFSTLFSIGACIILIKVVNKSTLHAKCDRPQCTVQYKQIYCPCQNDFNISSFTKLHIINHKHSPLLHFLTIWSKK